MTKVIGTDMPMEKLQFKFLSSVKPIRPCIYYMLDGETKVIAVVQWLNMYILYVRCTILLD